MLELIRLSIVDSETRFAEAAHDFAGVRPERIVEAVYVLSVVVAAENRVVVAALRYGFRNFGIMVQGDHAVISAYFAELPVQGHVFEARRDPCKQKLIPVVVPEHHVYGPGKPFGELFQGKGSTEIAKKTHDPGVAGLKLFQGFLEIPDVIVYVTENGDTHVSV